MYEKFAVAVPAGNGAGQPVPNAEPRLGTGRAQALLNLNVERGVAHDPALADVGRLQLKLRLDQQQRMTTGLQQRRQRRQHPRERDEGQIGHRDIEFNAK